MFRYSTNSASDSFDSSVSSFLAQVRAAHAMADLLKRTRPHLYDTVCELQATVTRCHHTLDQCQCAGKSPGEHSTAVQDLQVATQALLSLRHKGELSRSHSSSLVAGAQASEV